MALSELSLLICKICNPLLASTLLECWLPSTGGEEVRGERGNDLLPGEKPMCSFLGMQSMHSSKESLKTPFSEKNSHALLVKHPQKWIKNQEKPPKTDQKPMKKTDEKQPKTTKINQQAIKNQSRTGEKPTKHDQKPSMHQAHPFAGAERC